MKPALELGRMAGLWRCPVKSMAGERTLARRQDACIGVYGSTVRPGRVALGDAVTVA